MSVSRPIALFSALLLLTACTQAGATAVPATPSPAALATATAAATPTGAATPTEAAPTEGATATAEVPTTEPVTAPPATEQATVEPTVEPTGAATLPPIAVVCDPTTLNLKNPGRLTLSTDLPAFPPWWGGDAATQYPNEPEGGSPWTESDFSAEPYSMEGFEGATAYAIATAMGFQPDQVDWVANPSFAKAFAPGDKPFDFHMAQISITEKRAQNVTFSAPYFDSNQAVIGMTANDITSAASIADLKNFRLGAAATTTSLDFLENTIQPTVEPSVFDDNLAAVQALKSNTVDGIIVDLSSAFYMRDAQLEDFDTPDPEATIVGQFGPPAEPDHVGAVLELDNPLVDCVNMAIAEIQADGAAQAILDQWINNGEDVPFLE